MDTRQNKNLDQDSVQRQSENWNLVTSTTRLSGKPIRFSNRIHPLFTDHDDYWSFEAGKAVMPKWDDEDLPVCPETGSTHVVTFNHVQDVEPSNNYPTIYLLDPHPRKPHMMSWVQVNPSDDYQVVWEEQLDGTPDEVWRRVREVEEANQLYIAERIMDPNMGASPATARNRDQTWQMEFSEAGLHCDLASDSDVGRGRLNEFLQPDSFTLQPRFVIARRCEVSVSQMKRYCWDDFKRTVDKDQKQLPKTKYDDYPTMFKYLMNRMPTFRELRDGPQVLRLGGQRRGAY